MKLYTKGNVIYVNFANKKSCSYGVLQLDRTAGSARGTAYRKSARRKPRSKYAVLDLWKQFYGDNTTTDKNRG